MTSMIDVDTGYVRTFSTPDYVYEIAVDVPILVTYHRSSTMRDTTRDLDSRIAASLFCIIAMYILIRFSSV